MTSWTVQSRRGKSGLSPYGSKSPAYRPRRVKQEKQFLLTKLDGRVALNNRGLRGLNLMVSRRGSGSNPTLSRYPTQVDLTEHGEVVPEEDRPWQAKWHPILASNFKPNNNTLDVIL